MADLLNRDTQITSDINTLKQQIVSFIIALASTNSTVNETKTIYDAQFITQTALILKNPFEM